MKSYIQIAIRTKSETIDWGVGEKLIDSLNVSGGWLHPEQVSHNADKFTELFLGKSSCENIWASKASLRLNGVLSDFYQDFSWRRKKAIKSSGSVVHSSRNNRGQVVPGTISLKADYSDKVDWYSLFKVWCEIFSPQLGMVHLFTSPELAPADKNGSFQIGSFNAALKPDIPNVGWGMFYGDEFAREVNVDKVAAAGFRIEELGGGYLVRVTENISDVANEFSSFSKSRAELRNLFPEGFFLINNEPLV
ncbi:hypothetical protein LP085_31065 [Achromobacter sp. MY14]|uniref:hypothetical protein n=1 Tax=unclassified Achromobacter TaxID=2626865 RepID=UPI000FC08D51|nr:hypothetical protein [Achromobacter sp. MY14]MCD0501321.1 hypothetical protein [Achromobacter sp. MY14]